MGHEGKGRWFDFLEGCALHLGKSRGVKVSRNGFKLVWMGRDGMGRENRVFFLLSISYLRPDLYEVDLRSYGTRVTSL